MAHVRVRLQTACMQLIFEGDEAVFERQVEPLLLRLAGGRRTAVPVAAAPVPARPPEETVDGFRPSPSSFGTFHRQLADQPADTAAQIAAYAFYLWNYEKKETFLFDELAGCFAAGDESVPEDLAETCAALELRRVLQPAAKDGSWRLTPKGTNQVRKLLR